MFRLFTTSGKRASGAGLDRTGGVKEPEKRPFVSKGETKTKKDHSPYYGMGKGALKQGEFLPRWRRATDFRCSMEESWGGSTLYNRPRYSPEGGVGGDLGGHTYSTQNRLEGGGQTSETSPARIELRVWT